MDRKHRSFTLTGYVIRIVLEPIVSRRSSETLKRTTFAALLAAFLATAALGASLLSASGAGAAGMPCGESAVAPRQLSLHAMRTSVLCLLNRIRVHYDLQPLTYNADLRTSASAHSVSMVVHGYFAHEGPGGTMDGRISRAGYLAAAASFSIGEDIGGGQGSYGSPRAVVKDWMHSPPHRENILDPGFRDAGVGVARGFPFGGATRAATYTVDFGARGH
jgi:uncharacterized protein YkwD